MHYNRIRIVIIVKIFFICSFLLIVVVLYNHSFKTNPNTVTNLSKLFQTTSAQCVVIFYFYFWNRWYKRFSYVRKYECFAHDRWLCYWSSTCVWVSLSHWRYRKKRKERNTSHWQILYRCCCWCSMWFALYVGLICFPLTLNTAAIEHVLTFHSSII